MPQQKERILVLSSSPQNGKTEDMKDTDLKEDPVFYNTVRNFDMTLAGLDRVENPEFGFSLSYDRQIASVVFSVAAHKTFLSRLRSELNSSNLDLGNDQFKTIVLGHSIGEFASLMEANVLDQRLATRILWERERITTQPIALGEFVRGMIAVRGVQMRYLDAHLPQILTHFGGQVRATIANFNSPSEGVLSFESTGIDNKTIIDVISDKLAKIDITDSALLKLSQLPIPISFHSHFVLEEEHAFVRRLGELGVNDLLGAVPKGVIYSPMNDGWMDYPEEVLDIINHNLTRPVNYDKAWERLSRLNNIVAIICGDYSGLTPKLATKNIGERIPAVNIRNKKSLEAGIKKVLPLITN